MTYTYNALPHPDLPPAAPIPPAPPASIVRHRLWGLDLAIAIATIVGQIAIWVPLLTAQDMNRLSMSAGLFMTVGLALGGSTFGAWLVRCVVLLAQRTVSVWYVVAPTVVVVLGVLAMAVGVAQQI
ncbi:hypothetical protein [Tsukamurella pseudospumae]|uniref:Major facilitator superfamily (MFS) profile domain-containing protein n=1 Tax=Tsukamurella pseudospumae TaxID=239498 RepID=A0A137ZJ47_9ACTN|nr:hypothetical protein [Tsukamurella pseudospumae]KXO98208.1 hypothetical protein AXK61_19450 [Tsukamurella pseudospumae]